MLALIVLLQAVAGPPVPRDLKPLTIVKPCPSADGSGDIVVCGRQQNGPRLERLPDRDRGALPDDVSFRLPGGGKADLHALQSTLPGGTGQGAAVTFSIPFGKKK